MLELRAAAELVGVHYQTAYRWVRSGRLPARLVDGRYLVARADLDAVMERRRAPRRPPAPSPGRRGRAAARMHDALVAGDEGTARHLVRTLLDEGTTISDLVTDVIVPPLVRIGTDWHDGRLTIWVEHRASAIVERILGEHAPNPRGRRRGTAVVAAVSGDHHSLPTLMATVALRSDNWFVEHLGANMPPDELLRFCEEHDVTLAVLSSTNPETAELAADTAERLRRAGTPVILGGPGRRLDELLESARAAARAGSGAPSDDR
jgi:excisionase family DNA binding protein